MPKGKDLNDSDGDLISDSFDQNKYVSDMTELGQVTGEFKIILPHESKAFPFSNKASTRNGILKLITTGKTAKWGDIDIDVSENIVLDQDSYQVELKFNVNGDKPSQVIYIGETEKINLGDWQTVLLLTFSHDQIVKLLNGKSKLNLVRNNLTVQKNVDEKTFEIYLDDGMKSLLKNVSKKMSLEDFMIWQKIDKIQPLDEMDLLFSWPSEIKSWWYRQADSKKVAIAYTNTTELKKSLLKNFKKVDFHIGRVDGLPQESTPIITNVNAIHFYRVTATRQFNEFYEYPDQTVAEDSVCEYKKKQVKRANFVAITIDDLKSELRVLINNQVHSLNDLNARIEEKSDSHGIYWEIGFKSPTSILSFAMVQNPESSYVQTGTTSYHCYAGNPRVDQGRRNSENNFTLNVESFIEKME
jgi:hypothetical protein